MIKNVLERIGGIENYGIISILLFFACFLGALIWVFTLKKNYINKMKHLPLEDDDGEEAQLDSTPRSPSKP
jgi:cytochrome c oxidase cbb3-type subunit 4